MNINQLHEHFLKSKGVTTDTRSLQKDQIFFALTGDNFNGNTYAEIALNKGAGLVIIDQKEYKASEKCILVENTLKTLQDLATFHRNHLGIPILAITGSNGKTTSKELIHAVLRKKFNTVATVGNLNNHIGVPLTLLSMKKSTEFGIVEMGANHHKEIAALCNIAHPNYGYITNFGKAHLEGFGSLEGVVKAKSELYDYLKANKKLLFLNLSDSIQEKQSNYAHTYSFGQNSNADVQISINQNSPKASVQIENITINSQLTGQYNAVNIAAAVCVGKYFKIPTESIQSAIEGYTPKNNRSQLINLGSIILLMDAYNANPTSMRAALESFNNYKADKKVVILGDMFELGTSAKIEHQEIVNQLKEFKFDKAFITGSNFYESETNGNIVKFETFNSLADNLDLDELKGAHVLIKGSRGMALERIVDLIKTKQKQ